MKTPFKIFASIAFIAPLLAAPASAAVQTLAHGRIDYSVTVHDLPDDVSAAIVGPSFSINDGDENDYSVDDVFAPTTSGYFEAQARSSYSTLAFDVSTIGANVLYGFTNTSSEERTVSITASASSQAHFDLEGPPVPHPSTYGGGVVAGITSFFFGTSFSGAADDFETVSSTDFHLVDVLDAPWVETASFDDMVSLSIILEPYEILALSIYTEITATALTDGRTIAPIPGAVWLFGTAMGAFAFYRRRPGKCVPRMSGNAPKL